MKADYERQAASLSDILARLTAERAELANGVNNEHPALIAFMKYQNIETLNREILIELVDHIKVYENGNISVKFKFADELRRIAEYIEINTTQNPAVAGWYPPHTFLTVCIPNKKHSYEICEWSIYRFLLDDEKIVSICKFPICSYIESMKLYLITLLW